MTTAPTMLVPAQVSPDKNFRRQSAFHGITSMRSKGKFAKYVVSAKFNSLMEAAPANLAKS